MHSTRITCVEILNNFRKKFRLIDPNCITNYNYTDSELQEFLFFCVCVAGKTAKIQARLLEDFLNGLQGHSPFDKVRWAIENGFLEKKLRENHLGQYSRLIRTFTDCIDLDVRTCDVDDLEAVHGIGPKTARLFLMHTRPNVRLAALDTHILKMLKSKGYDVPKSTPSSKSLYAKLEEAFLLLADKAGMSPADFDLATWRSYANS